MNSNYVRHLRVLEHAIENIKKRTRIKVSCNGGSFLFNMDMSEASIYDRWVIS